MRGSWPLTLRGSAALVLAIGSFIAAGWAGSVQLLAVGVFLLALVAACLVAVRLARPEITVTRTATPASAAVGQTSRVRVRLGVRTMLPTTPGTWVDALGDAFRGDAGGDLPPMGSGLRAENAGIDLGYDVTAMRRGVHALGPLSVTVHDPFGIARRQGDVGGVTPVTVAPACVALVALPVAAGATTGASTATAARPGQGSDDLIARRYQPGDSMRRIHWRASAHVGRLMVRQEERDATPRATVVLDRSVVRFPGRTAHTPGGDPAFEAAVCACASVATTLARDGYTVQVMDAAGRPLADPLPGGDRAQIAAFAARLATTVVGGDDDLALLAQRVGGDDAEPLVLITGRLTDADVASLAAVPARRTRAVLLACGVTVRQPARHERTALGRRGESPSGRTPHTAQRPSPQVPERAQRDEGPGSSPTPSDDVLALAVADGWRAASVPVSQTVPSDGVAAAWARVVGIGNDAGGTSGAPGAGRPGGSP